MAETSMKLKTPIFQGITRQRPSVRGNQTLPEMPSGKTTGRIPNPYSQGYSLPYDAWISSGAASGSIPLKVGTTTIKVEVTAQDGATKRIYSIEIKREKSSVKDLEKLVVKGAMLNPKFEASKRIYKVEVAATKKAVQMKAWVKNSTARISINGKIVKSGKLSKPIKLKKSGITLIQIIVRDQDGSKRTYRVTFVRKE